MDGSPSRPRSTSGFRNVDVDEGAGGGHHDDLGAGAGGLRRADGLHQFVAAAR